MVRTPVCDKNGLKKGTWTPEEDRKLVAYVTRYGCWNWRQLPKYAGLQRCGKSCRLRWMNYLRPNIKRGNYTEEEEEKIIRLHRKHGNRWSTIAAELPGRTDNEIKNHWHTNLKKRVKEDKSTITSQNPKSDTEKEITSQNQEQDPTTNDGGVQIIESSSFALSPQPSSSDFSSLTTNDSIDVTSTEILLSDDSFAFLDAYEAAPVDDFWTKPFLSHNYFSPASDEYLASLALQPPQDSCLDLLDVLDGMPFWFV